jgi:hypothetical protein
LENLLAKAKLSESLIQIDLEHQHQLRRALLNSKFFELPPPDYWKFFSRQFVIKAFSFSLLTAGVIAILAIFNPGSFKPGILPVTSGQVSQAARGVLINSGSPVYGQAQNLLQDLYARGRIRYLRQQDGNTRIFRLLMADGQNLDFYDQRPYVINLINNN